MYLVASLIAIWVRLGTRLAWDRDNRALPSCFAMSSRVTTSPVALLDEPRVYIYLVSWSPAAPNTFTIRRVCATSFV